MSGKVLRRSLWVGLLWWVLLIRTVLQAQDKDLGVVPTQGELKGQRVYDNLHAIVVGVNKYRFLPATNWLQYAVKDAEVFRQLLIEQFGFPPENITLLLDEQATRQAIIDAIRNLARSGRVGKNDLVVLFFSMHGVIVPVEGEDLGFLIPYDAQTALGNPLNLDSLRASCVALDKAFWSDLEKCPAKHIIVLTDACHSGAIARSPVVSSLELEVLAKTRAIQVIASSTAKQQSFERPSLGHGVFTYALLETLREWADKHAGLPLRTTDLFSRVRSRVIELMGDDKQLPVFQNRVAGGECLWVPRALSPVVHTPTGHTSKVTSVAFSPDGRYLASGSADNTVRLWRVADGTLVRTLTGHKNEVTSVAFSPDGQYLASGSWDKTVRLWRVADGSLVRTLSGHRLWVFSIAFSPDGRYLASGGADNTIRLWRVADGTLVRTLTGHKNEVTSVAFSPDGQYLASGSLDETVLLWRVSDGSFVRTLTADLPLRFSVFSLTFSPDGRYLASGDAAGIVRLWRVADGTLVRTLSGHLIRVNSVAFSPNGRYLAVQVGSIIDIWRVADGTLVRTLTGHTGWVNSIAFSPDGRYLASGSADNTVRLWRVAEFVK
ncbi:MAG: caspase family protein [Fimbriimonadales bacterium]|nr:caspase family protein [Fimbriimonadales bacterium]